MWEKPVIGDLVDALVYMKRLEQANRLETESGLVVAKGWKGTGGNGEWLLMVANLMGGDGKLYNSDDCTTPNTLKTIDLDASCNVRIMSQWGMLICSPLSEKGP